MNKERVREILKDFSQQLNDRKVMLPTNSEIYKDNEDLLQALDIAIDSLEEEEIKDPEDLYLGLDIAIKILEKQREKVEPYERKE